jgi:hypothetical protein
MVSQSLLENARHGSDAACQYWQKVELIHVVDLLSSIVTWL